MAKRLAAADQTADPVRARFEAQSRISELASRAASPPKPAPAPARRELPPEPEELREDPSPEPAAVAAPEPIKTLPKPRVVPDRGKLRPTPPLNVDPGQEKTTIVRKTRFTPTEHEANQDIIQLVARLTKSNPSEAAVGRALWSLLREAEAGLKQQGRRGVTLKRPPNGSSIEMAEYERELSLFILAGLHSLEL